MSCRWDECCIYKSTCQCMPACSCVYAFDIELPTSCSDAACDAHNMKTHRHDGCMRWVAVERPPLRQPQPALRPCRLCKLRLCIDTPFRTSGTPHPKGSNNCSCLFLIGCCRFDTSLCCWRGCAQCLGVLGSARPAWAAAAAAGRRAGRPAAQQQARRSRAACRHLTAPGCPAG